MRIHIVGASGTGTTTLGKLLSAEINTPYFDTDDYFQEADLPHSMPDPQEGNSRLTEDLDAQSNWILGGSVIPWREALDPALDLIIFLWIPMELRIRRLKQREHARYGDVIFFDPKKRTQYENFITRAAQYDDTTHGQARAAHESWMRKLTCPVLELRGDYTLDERMSAVVREIKKIGYYPELDLLLP